jgi:hypothetical protein
MSCISLPNSIAHSKASHIQVRSSSNPSLLNIAKSVVEVWEKADSVNRDRAIKCGLPEIADQFDVASDVAVNILDYEDTNSTYHLAWLGNELLAVGICEEDRIEHLLTSPKSRAHLLDPSQQRISGSGSRIIKGIIQTRLDNSLDPGLNVESLDTSLGFYKKLGFEVKEDNYLSLSRESAMLIATGKK